MKLPVACTAMALSKSPSSKAFLNEWLRYSQLLQMLTNDLPKEGVRRNCTKRKAQFERDLLTHFFDCMFQGPFLMAMAQYTADSNKCHNFDSEMRASKLRTSFYIADRMETFYASEVEPSVLQDKWPAVCLELRKLEEIWTLPQHCFRQAPFDLC